MRVTCYKRIGLTPFSTLLFPPHYNKLYVHMKESFVLQWSHKTTTTTQRALVVQLRPDCPRLSSVCLLKYATLDIYDWCVPHKSCTGHSMDYIIVCFTPPAKSTVICQLSTAAAVHRGLLQCLERSTKTMLSIWTRWFTILQLYLQVFFFYSWTLWIFCLKNTIPKTLSYLWIN